MHSDPRKTDLPNAKLKVRFDNQIFQMQTRGGISHYFTRIIREFLDHPELGIVPILNIRVTINRHLVEAFPELKLRLVKNPVLVFLLKIQASVFGRHPGRDANLEHKTFYGLNLRWVRNFRVPVVTTLHDMIPELNGGGTWFSPHLFKRRDLSSADGVIAISNASLTQYRSVTAKPRPDVAVIPMGASKHSFPAGKPSVVLPSRYFLFVGQRSGHKNAMLALESFAGLSSAGWFLIFAGGGRASREERVIINRLGLTERVLFFAPSDQEMSLMYERAGALIMPSRIEGFGLPLLEAALSGCPVFASRIPVFEEVMSDGALYFDPTRASELTNLMRSLVNQELPLDRLKSRALSIARRFSWYECASLTAAYYREVLDAGRSSSGAKRT